jgi:hypothetical protein
MTGEMNDSAPERMRNQTHLTKKFHVQADSPHEQVDIAQALARHVGGERLAIPNSFHHTIPATIVSIQKAYHLNIYKGLLT